MGPSGIRPNSKPASNAEQALASIEVPATLRILKDDDIWVCDTAASNHFSKNCDGAYNVRNTSTMSTGMSGASVDATMMDFVMTQYSKTGAEGEDSSSLM